MNKLVVALAAVCAYFIVPTLPEELSPALAYQAGAAAIAVVALALWIAELRLEARLRNEARPQLEALRGEKPVRELTTAGRLEGGILGVFGRKGLLAYRDGRLSFETPRGATIFSYSLREIDRFYVSRELMHVRVGDRAHTVNFLSYYLFLMLFAGYPILVRLGLAVGRGPSRRLYPSMRPGIGSQSGGTGCELAATSPRRIGAAGAR